jgi:NAD(P)-dependent dehydrogenase (short-subunit alcohol dehydrogenase family)
MPNRIDLDGRFAIVTGGAQGIGLAITERFLDSGATVAIWDRDAPRAEKVAESLVGRGHGIIALDVDVADWRSVEKARDETLNAFKRIDILVNNGLADRSRTPATFRSKPGAMSWRSTWMGHSTAAARSFPRWSQTGTGGS